MSSIVDRVSELKKLIELSRQERAKYEGKLDSLKEQLSEFGIKSLEEAKEVYNESLIDIEQQQKSLDIAVKELESKYDW